MYWCTARCWGHQDPKREMLNDACRDSIRGTWTLLEEYCVRSHRSRSITEPLSFSFTEVSVASTLPHGGGVFVALCGRPWIDVAEGLEPTNATWHGPVAGGRVVSAGTRALASRSTPRRPRAVPVDDPVLTGGGRSELADVSRASTTRTVAT